MRNLVRRYVTQEQRKAENEGVTEDDVNEIKNDISAFRFEMIEIMRASGMNTQSASGPSGISRRFITMIKRILTLILFFSHYNLTYSIGKFKQGNRNMLTILIKRNYE